MAPPTIHQDTKGVRGENKEGTGPGGSFSDEFQGKAQLVSEKKDCKNPPDCTPTGSGVGAKCPPVVAVTKALRCVFLHTIPGPFFFFQRNGGIVTLLHLGAHEENANPID